MRSNPSGREMDDRDGLGSPLRLIARPDEKPISNGCQRLLTTANAFDYAIIRIGALQSGVAVQSGDSSELMELTVAAPLLMLIPMPNRDPAFSSCYRYAPSCFLSAAARIGDWQRLCS